MNNNVKPGMYQTWRELAPIAAWCAVFLGLEVGVVLGIYWWMGAGK